MTASISSSSILRNFSALITILKSVTAKGVRAIWNTLVPRLAIFCSTYTFAPCTIVITVMSVATPIVSPSTVSEARSLWARRALRHSAKLSRMANMAQQTSRVELYRISVGSIRKVSRHSVIGALLGMPTQVPAGLVAHVREQRMHAGHCDRALEIELGPIIF